MKLKKGWHDVEGAEVTQGHTMTLEKNNEWLLDHKTLTSCTTVPQTSMDAKQTECDFIQIELDDKPIGITVHTL